VTIPPDFARGWTRATPADPDRGGRHRPVGLERRDLDAVHGRPQALLREQGWRRRRRAAAGSLEVVVHRRYNPEGISQYNIVPGLLGVILQMTMVMMTSMALTRETERGTMENLLAMPASRWRSCSARSCPISRSARCR
jgi:ABC-2 type transport system permease protein